MSLHKWSMPFMALCMLGLPGAAMAEDDSTLKGVMRQLGQSMCRMSDAIFREDYNQIAETAKFVADHPRPSLLERAKIVAKLGRDMPQFKQKDDEVHDAALAVQQAAEKRDMQQVLQNHQRVMNSCMACHAGFRDRLRADTKKPE